MTQKVDDAITAPVARAYVHAVPRPIRTGVRNFLRNLREPVVFVNYLLQLKPGKAVETAGRFALNTTLGVAGVLDVARQCPFDLPWRENGFANTLGFYGVRPGPYIFVPLIGPTTVRDLVGSVVDSLGSPYMVGGPFRSKSYLIATNAYRTVERRTAQDEDLARSREAVSPYAVRRTQYLRNRRDAIDGLKGRPEASPSAAPRRCHPRPSPPSP